jgi:hypothetical protein
MNTGYGANWLTEQPEHEGRGSSPRRISKRSNAPTIALREWRSCALCLGLFIALAWTLKVAIGL